MPINYCFHVSIGRNMYCDFIIEINLNKIFLYLIFNYMFRQVILEKIKIWMPFF